jgi:hypothetical protein
MTPACGASSWCSRALELCRTWRWGRLRANGQDHHAVPAMSPLLQASPPPKASAPTSALVSRSPSRKSSSFGLQRLRRRRGQSPQRESRQHLRPDSLNNRLVDPLRSRTSATVRFSYISLACALSTDWGVECVISGAIRFSRADCVSTEKR